MDAIRALLIFGVLLFHFLVRWTPPMWPVDEYHFATRYSSLFEIGAYGVHLFFLVSGYFIAKTLRGSRDVVDFTFRRVSRIYPAYAAAATITFVFAALFAPPELKSSLKDYLLTLTMDPHDLHGRYVDGAFWSLTVEVKFYFWVAAAALLLRRFFWVGTIILGLAGVAAESRAPGISHAVLLGPYMAFFLFGISAWLLNDRQRVAAAVTALGGVICLYAERGSLTLGGQPSTLLLACVAAAAVLIYVTAVSSINVPVGRVLPFLGVISYEIYLVHQIVGITLIGALKRTFQIPDLMAVLAAMIVSVGLGYAVHARVGKPVATALRRWYDGRPLTRVRPPKTSGLDANAGV